MNEQAPIRRAGFARGLRWLPAAAELLFSGIGPLSGVAALWLLISLVSVIPLIGQLVVAILTPLLTAGAIAAFRESAAGRRPRPTTLLAGWQPAGRRRGLLLLGAWGIAGSIIAVAILAGWLGAQIPPEQLESAMGSPEALAQALQGVSLGPGLILAVLVIAVVLATMYFAIPLIMFAGLPVLRSLGLSLRAVFVNWAAFLGMGLAVIALIFALALVMVLALSVLGIALGTVGEFIGQVLFLIVAMAVQMLLAGTQYAAFRDVFDFDQGTGGGQEGDNALLA